MTVYLLLALSWAAWCVLHSAAITPGATAWLRERSPRSFRYQRLLYNAVALLTVVPLGIWTRDLRGQEIYRYAGPGVALRAALLLTAGLLLALGAKEYDLSRFLGLRQRQAGNAGRSGALRTEGVLRVTRHPWYLGGILFLWSHSVSFHLADVVAGTVLTVYLIVGSLLEERKLRRVFGDRYRAYQAEVSMLIPFRWVRASIRRAFRRAD